MALFAAGATIMMRRMALVVPFAGVDRRIAWLRATLLTACFVSLIACAPVWANLRAFPLLRITPGFPALPTPWDGCFFGALLLSLVAAGWFYRPAVTFFLLASLFAFCEDQNRGQPWLYMYWVMLGLTLLPENVVLPACRCALSAAYVWSSIQKCNARFFQIVPAWFVEPAATHWHFPVWTVHVLRYAVSSAPFVELAIGIALWPTRFRRVAIGMVLTLHLSALLFLGPLGYRYDMVVWPWNLAMIALVVVLFGKGTERTPKAFGAALRESATTKAQSWSSALRSSFFWQTVTELRRSRLAVVIIALFSFLPALSYAGLWDSYFSFALFAESQAKADIFVTEAFRSRLPAGIAAHVHAVRQAYNPQVQGPYVFDFQTWGYKQLRVPPIFEPRNYRSIFKYLRTWSRTPDDLRMIIAPRAGPMVFYEANAQFALGPSK
jgi:hypothetical protein